MKKEENAKPKKKKSWADIEPSNEYNDTQKGKKKYTSSHVSNYRPEEEEWFRVIGKTLADIKKGIFVKIKIDHERIDHLVMGNADFEQRVIGEFSKFRKVYLAYYVTRAGRMGIWPVSVPRQSKKQNGAYKFNTNKWSDTGIQIIENAQKRWCRVIANRDLGVYEGYQVNKENEALWGEPNFKLDYFDAVLMGFEGRILDEDNYDTHEYVQDLIQQKMSLKIAEESEEE